jgi:hypothetical protein
MEDDPIVALMARLESLIENVIERKFSERDQQIADLAAALKETHKLVNSRMTRMLELANQLAEAEEEVAVNKAEKRGGDRERSRAAHETKQSKGDD